MKDTKLQKNLLFLTAMAAVLVVPSFVFAAEAAKEDIAGRDRYLLLDSRVVGSTVNAVLKVGTVEKHGRPLFREDKPWESRFDNMEPNVMWDEEEKIFKLWYGMFIRDAENKPPQDKWTEVPYRPRGREDGVCYATSKDGLTWEKPELGVIEFEGSKKNNLVGRGDHGAGVFKDMHEKDPARRYKMVFKRGRQMQCRFSADGIHFGESTEMYRYKTKHGDTHNHALWCPDQKKYVMITRLWTDGRSVGRSESVDFEKWTLPEEVMRQSGDNRQVYTLPTFYYAGVYIGMPVLYFDDRPYPELAWSPDTKQWHRIDEGTPFIPRAEKEYAMDWGCVYPAVAPIVMPDKTIRIYYLASNWYHRRWRDGFWTLATLRPDGWAGFEQASKDKPAVITTKPIPYAGQKIQVTADVAPGGSVKVTILDSKGKELKTTTISKTVTDEAVSSAKEFKGDKITLKFELDKAKVYSFSLGD